VSVTVGIDTMSSVISTLAHELLSSKCVTV